MTEFAPVQGLVGGMMIGLAAVLLMLGIGRIAGICGIVLSAMLPGDGANRPWRLAFLAGLPIGAILVYVLGVRQWSGLTFPAGAFATIIAGLIVGIGTTCGSGCTSGHGVCGLARLSPRSIVATLTFMITGAATVFVVRHLI